MKKILLIGSLFFITSAFAEKFSPENTNLYFVYCPNGEGYYRKLEWKEMGDGKPIFLKKGEDSFRVEVFFARDESTYDALKKIRGSDVIESYLRQGDTRDNSKLILNDTGFAENETMTSIAGNFYMGLYLTKKEVTEAELTKKAVEQCNESAKRVQGMGNVDEIRNKRTTKLNPIDLDPKAGME